MYSDSTFASTDFAEFSTFSDIPFGYVFRRIKTNVEFNNDIDIISFFSSANTNIKTKVVNTDNIETKLYVNNNIIIKTRVESLETKTF